MIIVTGASGTLGAPLTRRLAAADAADVHAVSRRSRTSENGVTWHQADLKTGDGLGAALTGADTIVHCASDWRHYKDDLTAARNLVDAAWKLGAPHLVYISIVGVDKIPYPYYRVKHEVERLIEDSGLPYTILRTTQFHTLPAMVLDVLTKAPGLMPLPSGLRVQPIDADEVAERLADLALAPGPARRVDDMGGPEVLTLEEMAKSFLQARGKRNLRLPFPLFGKTVRAFKEGHHLTPGKKAGKRTWQEYLDEQWPRR